MYAITTEDVVSAFFCAAMQESSQFRVVSLKSLDLWADYFVRTLTSRGFECYLSVDRNNFSSFASSSCNVLKVFVLDSVSDGFSRIELTRVASVQAIAEKFGTTVNAEVVKCVDDELCKDFCHTLAVKDLVRYLQLVVGDKALSYYCAVPQKALSRMTQGMRRTSYEWEILRLAEVVWDCVYASGQQSVTTTRKYLYNSVEGLWEEAPIETYRRDRYARYKQSYINGPVLSAFDMLQ